MLHDPGIDRMQAEIPERKGQELRAEEGPKAPLAEGFSPGRPQNVAVLKTRSTLFRPAIPVGLSWRSKQTLRKCVSRCAMILSSAGVTICLRLPQIKPLVILFPGKPARHQLEEFGPVQG